VSLIKGPRWLPEISEQQSALDRRGSGSIKGEMLLVEID